MRSPTVPSLHSTASMNLTDKDLTIFWHRRDLRADDNAGLFKALDESENVLPLFIFDSNILDELEDKDDQRVVFIHDYLSDLKEKYEKAGGSMLVKHGKPKEIWQQLTREYKIKAVYTNTDYEPYARERDEWVADFLKDQDVAFYCVKDQIIFEKDEVVKGDGDPYLVFTPYMKKWKGRFKEEDAAAFDSEGLLKDKLCKTDALPMLSLKDIGFERGETFFPPQDPDLETIKKYEDRRDIPSVKGTSRMSVHLRFGTVSIRTLTRIGRKHSEKWLNELIWRNFYMVVLWHFPHAATKALKPEYDNIPWRNDEKEFEAWCEGKTGYPIIDAGMRELNETGFMHNRVRMIVASFLVKHLLIDWRWGEAYFARKLLDYELASNNGGWQWAAGSGCDAAPYFRIFNPELQVDKYDSDYKYINKWVPEFETKDYPDRIVAHKPARERALETYKDALGYGDS